MSVENLQAKAYIRPVPLRLIKNQGNEGINISHAVTETHLNHRSIEAEDTQRVDTTKVNSDGLIILRINEFEFIEETFGHEVAKELFLRVHERLNGCLRSVDFLERISSNEVCIVTLNNNTESTIERLIKRFQEKCNGEYLCHGFKVYASLSAGASLTTSNTKYEDNIRFARIALRHSQERKDDSLQFYRPNMLNQMQQHAKMLFELRQALVNDDFVLHYQPQYDVHTEETVSVEALLRMKNSNGELLYPDRFLSIAEESGLIINIGHWVIQEACRQYRQWQVLGCAPRHVAVNVSAKQLEDKNLLKIIDTAVFENGIDYENLELEITEQNLIEHIAQAQKILSELKARGVRIALDDFGTGYSSLAYLGQLPLNVLKIDRLFLQQLNENKNSGSIIRSIVYIAKELNLEVVAEGMETREHREFIKMAGCHFGQGYGYSKPTDAATLTDKFLPQLMQVCI